MSARVARLSWVLDYLWDIESDLSVFHRIDDIWSMRPARFFRLASRLDAYDGALAKRLLINQQREQEEAAQISTAAEIAASPLSEYVSIAQV